MYVIVVIGNCPWKILCEPVVIRLCWRSIGCVIFVTYELSEEPCKRWRMRERVTRNLKKTRAANLECEYLHLVEEMRDLFEEEESSRGTVIAYCKVTLQEEILREVLRSENEKVVGEWIRKIPLADLEMGSGYYWVLRNVNRSNDGSKFSATLACSSRSDLGLTRRTARANQPYERRPEKKCKIDRYDCRGVVNVKVCIEKKEMELTLTHFCPHPKPEYKGDATRSGRRAQVNFWMAEKLAKLYVRNADNQLLSSKQLIESSEFQSKGFEVVFYEDTATLASISFVTSFWCRVRSVKEIVIDSTFKTNSLRFELFCIYANVGGVGMPLCYLLYSKHRVTQPTAGSREPRSGKDRVRKEMLKRWFSTLREKGLKHIFAVIDKDVGQIGGIEETFPNTYVQMCLWHAQRAVELRIQLLDAPIRPYDAAAAHAVHEFIDETWIPENLLQRGHICPVDSKKSVLWMFSRHYDMSPLVPRRDGFYSSAEELYRKACKEAYEWCRSNDLVHFWGYLWNQWYCPKKWRRFSRSAKPLLCFSRTTNIAESHWRLLKYNYKYECNRPRLDKLVYILLTGFMQDRSISFLQFDVSREQPSWWLKFRSRWNKYSSEERDPNTPFHDLEKWVCSCIEFRRDHTFYVVTWCSAISLVEENFHDTRTVTKGEEFQAVDNVVHDWTGDEFQTEADIGHPEPTNDTDDYLQKFKEKWLKLVQNTEYLVEKEHDNEKFIEAVDKALYSFDRAIGQCMTALGLDGNSRHEQKRALVCGFVEMFTYFNKSGSITIL
ncbi:hypothetical protein R1sor_011371 [Riccia sorocarpa]|uniref:MULE transposase domain-containing protein n=1 Tax=Riccia sorocarpa TaxID=122646 RepID=A0ABD3I4L5_9MARC